MTTIRVATEADAEEILAIYANILSRQRSRLNMLCRP